MRGSAALEATDEEAANASAFLVGGSGNNSSNNSSNGSGNKKLNGLKNVGSGGDIKYPANCASR